MAWGSTPLTAVRLMKAVHCRAAGAGLVRLNLQNATSAVTQYHLQPQVRPGTGWPHPPHGHIIKRGQWGAFLLPVMALLIHMQARCLHHCLKK